MADQGAHQVNDFQIMSARSNEARSEMRGRTEEPRLTRHNPGVGIMDLAHHFIRVCGTKGPGRRDQLADTALRWIRPAVQPSAIIRLLGGPDI
jgi:hypothetical protein